MSKRDYITAVVIYFFGAQIPVLSFSLLFNSWPVFWVGQILAIPVCILAPALTKIASKN